MSKRILGTIIGIIASFIGVLIWCVMYVFVGIIANVTGCLCGFFFIYFYKKINRQENSKYPYICGGIMIVIDCFIAVLGCMLAYSLIEKKNFNYIINNNELLIYYIFDLLGGLCFSAIIYISYVLKRIKVQKVNDENII